MKTIILTFVAIALAVPCFGAEYGGASFALMSAASGAVKTTSALNVRGFKTKSLQVSGATLASNPTSTTFKNMSGTLIAQCSQDGQVWDTCIANDYAQTAVSRTTNGIFTWSSAFNYIRLKWTAGTVGGKLKSWIGWTEN